jgi:leucyl aminopeptidase
VPSLAVSTDRPDHVSADVLVLAVAAPTEPGADPELLGDVPDPVHAALPAGVLRAIGVTGRPDTVVRVPVAGLGAPVVALTGVGKGTMPDHETMRRAAGAAARELAGTSVAAFALPVADGQGFAAVAEGALLGAYAFGRYRVASAEGRQAPLEHAVVVAPGEAAGAGDDVVRRAGVLADAVALVRDLVNTSPSDLYPESFAEQAAGAAGTLPVEVTVLDEQQLVDGGYGGLLGVGKGSARPPRLVRLDYAPEGARGHVALVGKGITFDSGGLSIKPAAGMEDMKSDMAGAAAVLATVVAAARLGLPVRVSGWLALAENMPSGTAQRPSDVLAVRGGRTVEVLNTDAEGRLVMADAIVAACETGPDLVVDVATLTGAQVVALGRRVSAVMANDDALRGRLVRVAGEAGELLWPMPLPPELRSSLDSPVADLANIGERFGGMLVAGIFLSEFVGTRTRTSDDDGGDGDDAPGEQKIPWAHLDIAGPAYNGQAAHGYTPKGGTGVMVRTLVHLLEDVAASGA